MERDTMVDVMGMLVEPPPPAMGADWIAMRAVLVPGASTTLRRHEDRITAISTAGAFETWWGGGWRNHAEGEIVEISPHAPHAFRNVGPRSVKLLLIATTRLKNFMMDVGVGPDVERTDERAAREARRAIDYGYRIESWTDRDRSRPDAS